MLAALTLAQAERVRGSDSPAGGGESRELRGETVIF